MTKQVRILPTTIRIENISLLDFLQDLPEVLKNVPELADIRANTVTLLSQKEGIINMSYTSEDSFNLSGLRPEVLDKVVEAIRRYYEVKPK